VKGKIMADFKTLCATPNSQGLVSSDLDIPCDFFKEQNPFNDPFKKPRILGAGLENICAYRKAITNPYDSIFLTHNPDDYQFCKKDNNYYAIHPSPEKFQNINIIVTQTYQINHNSDLLKVKRNVNDELENDLSSEERLLSDKYVAFGILGAVIGAYTFGKWTHSFDLLSETQIVSSKSLTSLRRQWAQVEYGQKIIKEELKKGDKPNGSTSSDSRCSKFSDNLDIQKKDARFATLRYLLTLSALILFSLTDPEPVIKLPPEKNELPKLKNQPTSGEEKKTPSNDSLTLGTGEGLHNDAELNFRSVRYGETEEQIRTERIEINRVAESLTHLLTKEEERTEGLRKRKKELENASPIYKLVMGGAGTGFIFGIMVPAVHYFSLLKPFLNTLKAAQSDLKTERMREAYQQIIRNGQEDAKTLYRNSCDQREPPPVEISVAQPIGIPIPIESKPPDITPEQLELIHWKTTFQRKLELEVSHRFLFFWGSKIDLGREAHLKDRLKDFQIALDQGDIARAKIIQNKLENLWNLYQDIESESSERTRLFATKKLPLYSLGIGTVGSIAFGLAVASGVTATGTTLGATGGAAATGGKAALLGTATLAAANDNALLLAASFLAWINLNE